MATIAPSSEVYLVKAPIESDNLNHLNFANQTAQINYFTSLPKKAFDRYTYIRKENAIRVEGNAEELMRYNYLMYKNDDYGNKWIFAFITNVKYLNDNVALITFRTDVFNTWYFDVTFKPSYVEREHTNDDSIGANILAEDTSEGEYILNSGTEVPIVDISQGYWIAIQCSDAPLEIKNYLQSNTRVYGGLRSGAWIFMVEATTAGSNANFDNLIKWFDYDNKTDAIIAMYVMPKYFAPSAVVMSLQDSTGTYSADIYALPTSTTPYHGDMVSVPINTSIDGYVPKNNRLFCYPYNYLRASNHAGSDTIYRWEEFTTSDHHGEFYVYSIPNQGIDSRLIPKNYKYSSNNIFAFYDFGLTGGKLPLLSWHSDYYLNWQATNGINIPAHTYEYAEQYTRNTGLTSQIENPIGKMTERDIGSAVFGGLQIDAAWASGAGQWIKSITADLGGAGYRAYMTPDTIQGCANVGDLNFSCHMNTFGLQRMSIKAEMAAIIDQFFSMFGYKTLKVKIPNINGRANWNYVKTKQANIEGDIPQVDMQELKAIFNNGVTIWHNPNTFLDYSQNNAITA